MADMEKKEQTENTKIWMSWEQKEFFRWNKKYFSQLIKGYRTQALNFQ